MGRGVGQRGGGGERGGTLWVLTLSSGQGKGTWDTRLDLF